MSFDFTESACLTLPDVKNDLTKISEGEAKSTQKIIVEIAAIHEGLTANYNHYSAEALEKSISSWTSPYPKPIITNHDPDSDPLGRAMAAVMKKELDETPYIALQAAITSPNAMERLADKRYLTGSVGGRAGKVLCSVCGTDWAKPSESLPCKHRRGQVYNGKLAYFDMHDISWKEYSFVNVPADSQSSVRDMETSESENTVPVKFYSLDLNNESVYELAENEQPENILAKMKKKDAHFTYMNLKGTFLSVSAFDDRDSLETDKSQKSDFIEDNTTMNNEPEKERNMSDTQNSVIEDEQEDDVLSAVNSLSADLAADASTEEAEEEETEEAADEADKTETESEEEAAEESTEKEEDSTTEEADALADKDSNDLDTAEKTEEDSEVAKEESVKVEDNAELDALREANDKLTQENAKLKQAIKAMLVERVVDTKIALGLVEKTERVDSISEHEKRSASSLADNLRDLAKMAPIVNKSTETEKVALGNKSVAVGKEKNVETTDRKLVVEEKPVDFERKLEEKLVNVLMNRTHL